MYSDTSDDGREPGKPDDVEVCVDCLGKSLNEIDMSPTFDEACSLNVRDDVIPGVEMGTVFELSDRLAIVALAVVLVSTNWLNVLSAVESV